MRLNNFRPVYQTRRRENDRLAEVFSAKALRRFLSSRRHRDLKSADSVNTQPDDRSQMAIAYAWAARVMTVSMEMVAPGIGGVWLDNWLGTKVLFTVIGLAFGMGFGMWHLLRMTKSNSNETYDKNDSADGADEK